MSVNKWTLGIFHELSGAPADTLARLLTERGIVAQAEADPLTLAHQLVATDAIKSQLQLLTESELDALDSLFEVATATGHHSPAANDPGGLPEQAHARQLVHTFDATTALRPEIASLWPDIRAHREGATPPVVSSAEPREGAAPIDVPAVMSALEGIEMLLAAASAQPVDSTLLPDDEVWAARLGPDARGQRPWSQLGELAQRTGLLGQRGHKWLVTERGIQWRRRAVVERWCHLVHTLWSQAPTWFTRALGEGASGEGNPLVAYPLVDRDVWDHWGELALRVGVLVEGRPSPLVEVLRTQGDIDQVMREALPEPLRQLYSDGPDSVIAAGVLDSAVETTLRGIGQWISGGMAPRFTINQATVLGGLQRGVSEAQIRDFVDRALPGGLSGSVGQMVNDTLERAEAITVEIAEGGSRLRVRDRLLVDLLHADRRLQSLGLVALSETEFTSGHSVEHIHRLLLAESYPHLVVGPGGEPVDVEGHDVVLRLPAQGGAWSTVDTEALVAQWQRQKADEPAQWFLPLLEVCISEKLAVRVGVNMGDQVATLQVEPRSVQNGRLRARDTRSDVERTIPVKQIVWIDQGGAVSDAS